MSAKLDEPSLVWMEFQAKLGHPFFQGCKAFGRLGFIAEAYDKIVCISDDYNCSSGYPLPPLFDPKV
jgi:hypothetical protein